MKITCDIIGVEEIEKAFNEKVKKVKKFSAKEMENVVVDLFEKSNRLAPVKSGNLIASGTAEVNGSVIAIGNQNGGINVVGSAPDTQGDEVYGEVGYSADYALEQHEDLTFEHDTGQAKYLEQPFNENFDKYIDQISKKIDDAIGDGEL